MIWRGSEIQDGQQYRLQLCETQNGNRYFRLVALASDEDSPLAADICLVTSVVENELLKYRSFHRIADSTLLANGDRFFVDAHGTWLTQAEEQALRTGRHFGDIPWLNGQVPQFALK